MSNKKCCVSGCPNIEGSQEILHKFPNPAKNKELFNTWVYSVGSELLELENEHIFKYRRVCHRHFEQKYHNRNNRLSNIAVPTQNIPGLSVSKFTSASHERRPLNPIQNISASTSKEGAPVATQLSQNNEGDVQNKENREHVMGEAHITSHLDSEILDSTKSSELQDRMKKRKRVPVKKLRKRVLVSLTEQALYRKLIQANVKLNKCRSKVKKQAVKIKVAQNIMSNPKFIKTLDNLPSRAKILTLMQFREYKKKNKGRRFTMQEKIVALSMLKQSPKGYRFLRKIFILPSPQSLVKLINMANIRPGVNKNTMQQIKMVAEKMKIEERLCIVIFDEMSLKANLSYNERKDKVSGFVTNGQETRPEFADHAQVFMIRGLLRNYKQPVAYTFSQASTKGPELARQLKEVIKELQAAGLIVVATVCDQGTNNMQCIKLLIQETQGTLLRKGLEPKPNVFMINDQEIIPLYDPPHLIKCIRNNLITKDLRYIKDNQTKTAKWSHITDLHRENPGYKGIRLVPKLTDNHCIPNKIPRMKVKYATQIFSQTVASNMGYLADKGILPSDSKDTADILLFFDRVFDSLNGSFGKRKKHGKPLLGPATPTSVHHQVWQESKTMLKNMKFINAKSLQAERVPTLKNWVWTLEGIDLLLKNLEIKYDVTSVWLRHLNQDPIENFFGAIRSHGCRNVNPTPERFESAYTTLLINSLSSVHSPGSNCEGDDCFVLHEILITGGDCREPTCTEIGNIPNIIITPLEDKNDHRQIGGLQYVSGYFVRYAKKKVFKGCNQCKTDLMSDCEPEYLKYREYAKKQWLCSPSNSLLCCISGIQDINYSILKENLEQNNLKELIKTIILIFIEFDFIECQIHKNKLIDCLIMISCRFFIYNYCKNINKILEQKRVCDDEDDLFKNKAKRYAMKCFKRK